MRNQKGLFKIGDILLSVLILAVALALFLAFTHRGEAAYVVIVSEAGEERYPLSEDRTLTVESNGYTLTVEISDGRARVASADCPDKVCAASGYVSSGGETVVCVPARVQIKAEGGETDDVIDWVAP